VETEAGRFSVRFRPSDHPQCAAKGVTVLAGGKAAGAAAGCALCPAAPTAATRKTAMARVIVTVIPSIRN